MRATTTPPSTAEFAVSRRRFEGPFQDLNAGLLVTLGRSFVPSDRLDTPQQREAAAGDNSLGYRGFGGTDGVIQRFLLRLHLCFGWSSDADHGNATGQLGKPFLELFAIVVAGGFLDLPPNLLNAGVDLHSISATADQRCIFLVCDDARCWSCRCPAPSGAIP